MSSIYDYLQASDLTGDVPLIHVNVIRLTGSATLKVDSVDNLPAKFIATIGTLLASGFIDPATKINVLAHLSGSDIIIDSYEPGSTDAGNTVGQVVVVKPTTGWADRVADFLQAAANSSLNRIVSSITSSATPAPNADTTNQFDITALAANATVAAPTGTPLDGQVLLFRIKDNGTARTLAWNAIYRELGVGLPSTTVLGKTLYLGFIYNAADTKWDLVSIAQQV